MMFFTERKLQRRTEELGAKRYLGHRSLTPLQTMEGKLSENESNTFLADFIPEGEINNSVNTVNISGFRTFSGTAGHYRSFKTVRTGHICNHKNQLEPIQFYSECLFQWKGIDGTEIRLPGLFHVICWNITSEQFWNRILLPIYFIRLRLRPISFFSQDNMRFSRSGFYILGILHR